MFFTQYFLEINHYIFLGLPDNFYQAYVIDLSYYL